MAFEKFKREGEKFTSDMELCYPVCSFPKLTFVRFGLGNVCPVVEVDDAIM